MKKALTTAFLTLATLVLTGTQALAAGEGGAAHNAHTVDAFLAIAAGLGIGVAAFGGAIAQGRAAASALEGIARNPGASGKIFTPLILALALIESLVIYALVISFVLSGNIGG